MDVIPDNSSDDSINSSEVSSSDYSVDFATEKDSISLSLMTHKLWVISYDENNEIADK